MPEASTHTWFWFFGALFIVGAFLAAGGFLRRSLDVIDRASRLLATTGLVLAVIGVAGAFAVAATTPGAMADTMKDMMGMGSVVSAPAPPPKPGAPTVRVTGVDFAFQPSTLTVSTGKETDVVFRNGGQSPHTFTVEGVGFELKADPGQSSSGALQALKPGTYAFICSIPGHAQLGMKGSLVVS
ncbi:MAG: cupredoxin domain-containing protein [Actinomycetota bacterium]